MAECVAASFVADTSFQSPLTVASLLPPLRTPVVGAAGDSHRENPGSSVMGPPLGPADALPNPAFICSDVWGSSLHTTAARSRSSSASSANCSDSSGDSWGDRFSAGPRSFGRQRVEFLEGFVDELITELSTSASASGSTCASGGEAGGQAGTAIDDKVSVPPLLGRFKLYGRGVDDDIPSARTCPEDGGSSEVVDAAVESSIGSAAHFSGRCTPCAWHHRDGGCTNGSLCKFCHVCPDGAVKQLKWEKHQARKVAVKLAAVERETLRVLSEGGTPAVPAPTVDPLLAGASPAVAGESPTSRCGREVEGLLVAIDLTQESAVTSQGHGTPRRGRPWARGSFRRAAATRAGASARKTPK